MIICAGNNETFAFATPIGVGLIESAMNLTQLCLFDKPSFLLFIGTAGSYGQHKPFDIIESKTAANIETGFVQKQCYTPLDNLISTQDQPHNDMIVNSSNYITTDEKVAARMQSIGMSIENMEFFAVLHVAKTFDIPAGGVFCITNYCNAQAHEDFVANQREAMRRLSEHVATRADTLTR